jgi:CMP-N-acetylneuraminic acid synthetase
MNRIKRKTMPQIIEQMLVRHDIDAILHTGLIDEILDFIEDEKDEAYKVGLEHGRMPG